MTKAVIFDLDGTLMDTLTDLYLSVNFALKEMGFKERTLTEIKSFVGNGVGPLIERSLPETEKDKAPKCLEIFTEYYDKHKENTKPYGGVSEMIRGVKAMGYKTAILSNKYDRAVKELAASAFPGLIDFAAGEAEGRRPKPYPDGAEFILNQLGCKKENAYFVGDSDVDVKTAFNSGLKLIAVSWGFRDKSLLEELGAKDIIDAPSQIFDIVK